MLSSFAKLSERVGEDGIGHLRALSTRCLMVIMMMTMTCNPSGSQIFSVIDDFHLHNAFVIIIVIIFLLALVLQII